MDEADPAYGKIMTYIDRNPAAVLSTTGKDGAPHGAVVYVCTASHGTVCFVTKNLTKKYANLVDHPQVCLTFYNEKESSTLQISGKAFIADNPDMIDYVMDKIAKVHALQSDWLPPVSKVQAGEYAVVGVELTHARLAEFQGMGIGSNSIFTELNV